MSLVARQSPISSMTSLYAHQTPHSLMDHHVINLAPNQLSQNPPQLSNLPPLQPSTAQPLPPQLNVPSFAYNSTNFSSPASALLIGTQQTVHAKLRSTDIPYDRTQGTLGVPLQTWKSPPDLPFASFVGQQSHLVPNAPTTVPRDFDMSSTSTAVPNRKPSPDYLPSSSSPPGGPYPPLPTSQPSLFPSRVSSPEPEATLARTNKRRSGSESDCGTNGEGRNSDREATAASAGAPPRRKSAKPFRSPSRSSPNPGFRELSASIGGLDGEKEIVTVPEASLQLPTILEMSPEPPQLIQSVIKLDVFHMYRVRPRTLLYDKKLQKRLREIKTRTLERWIEPADSRPATTAREVKENRARRDKERRDRERERDRERDRDRTLERPDRALHNVLYQQRTPSGEIVLTSSRSRQRHFGSVVGSQDIVALRNPSEDGRMMGYDSTEHELASSGSETRRDSLSDDQLSGTALTKMPKRRGRKPNLTRVAAIALHQGAVNVTGLAGIADLINSVAGGNGEASEGDNLTEAQRKGSLAALARLQSRPEDTAGAPMVSWKGTPLPVTPDMIGYNLLTVEEKRICSILRLYPEQYLKIKETLLTAKETRGFFKKREAQKMCRVDVNKTAKIYDWFIALGWLPFGEVHPEEL
ncbi:Transcriptional adapter ada2 [Gonapodya sp. JEL0774]|nr:Transcriptional adapter ada2 [Gonapodya sp. JEL0774]